jgi:hypothetical protein
MNARMVSSAVSQVLEQLRQKPLASPKDIYVWSDGSVTGPPGEAASEDPHMIALFSPHEPIDEAAVRKTIENGLREAPPANRGGRQDVRPAPRR